jgi:acetoacetate decarboxylase
MSVGTPTNIPLHHPLYRTVGNYSGTCFGISLLMEVDRQAVEQVLAPTPFSFVSAHAWVEAYVYPTTSQMAEYEDSFGDPYASFGVVLPVRYGDEVGGYYAHTFKNKDYGTAPGREVAGFPIKYAALRMQQTGRAVSGTAERPTARFNLSLVRSGSSSPKAPPVDVPRSPHLLIQSIPSVERDEVMLQQVIRRDVSSSSTLSSQSGEGSIEFLPTPSGVDELAWMKNGKVIYGEYFSGLFRGAFGTVLSSSASASLHKSLAVDSAATR